MKRIYILLLASVLALTSHSSPALVNASENKSDTIFGEYDVLTPYLARQPYIILDECFRTSLDSALTSRNFIVGKSDSKLVIVTDNPVFFKNDAYSFTNTKNLSEFLSHTGFIKNKSDEFLGSTYSTQCGDTITYSQRNHRVFNPINQRSSIENIAWDITQGRFLSRTNTTVFKNIIGHNVSKLANELGIPEEYFKNIEDVRIIGPWHVDLRSFYNNQIEYPCWRKTNDFPSFQINFKILNNRIQEAEIISNEMFELGLGHYNVALKEFPYSDRGYTVSDTYTSSNPSAKNALETGNFVIRRFRSDLILISDNISKISNGIIMASPIIELKTINDSISVVHKDNKHIFGTFNGDTIIYCKSREKNEDGQIHLLSATSTDDSGFIRLYGKFDIIHIGCPISEISEFLSLAPSLLKGIANIIVIDPSNVDLTDYYGNRIYNEHPVLEYDFSFSNGSYFIFKIDENSKLKEYEYGRISNIPNTNISDDVKDFLKGILKK